MQKNVASKLIVYAFDSTTNLPKTGDAANLTAYVSKDYGAATVLADTTATEVDATNAKGYYLFDLAQAETNANTLLFSAKSGTSNIVVLGMPATVFTVPANFPALVIDSSGLADANAVKIGPTGSGTAQTARDVGASVLLAAGQKVDVDTIKTNPVVNAGTVTFPTGATLASTTNITAGTIATVTNLTNAPTAGDLTATMKTSVTTAASAATPVATVSGDFSATMKTSLNAATPASVTGAVGSVTGAVGSIGTGGISSSSFAASAIDAAAIATDAIGSAELASSAVDEIWQKSCTEPTGVVAASPQAIAALSWLLTLSRNKIEQTSTTQTLRADDSTTAIAASTVADDGTTGSRAKFA